jgi:hypothetical protein
MPFLRGAFNGWRAELRRRPLGQELRRRHRGQGSRSSPLQRLVEAPRLQQHILRCSHAAPPKADKSAGVLRRGTSADAPTALQRRVKAPRLQQTRRASPPVCFGAEPARTPRRSGAATAACRCSHAAPPACPRAVRKRNRLRDRLTKPVRVGNCRAAFTRGGGGPAPTRRTGRTRPASTRSARE